MRFSDNIDRLYITTADFAADSLLSDDTVERSGGVIAVFNESNKDPVPHVYTESSRILLYWRTSQRNNGGDLGAAAGFRLLAYPSGILVVHLFLEIPLPSLLFSYFQTHMRSDPVRLYVYFVSFYEL